MGDYYHATVEVYAWPADSVSWQVEVLDSLVIAGYIAQEEHNAFVADDAGDADDVAMHERRGQAWQVIAETLGDEHGPELDFDAALTDDLTAREGKLTASGECNYGLMEWTNAGLFDALRTLELPYFATDDGHYEYAGVWTAWAPSFAEQETGTYAGGDVVLTASEWQGILNRADGASEIAAAVTAHFNVAQRVADAPAGEQVSA